MERTEGEVIGVVGGAFERDLADADGVAGIARDVEGEERVGVVFHAVIAGDEDAVVVEQLQRGRGGFGADAAGFEVEDEGLIGAGGEGEFGVRAGFFEDAPDAEGQRRERDGCAGFRRSRGGDLREVVEGEFEFLAFAGGVDGAEFDGRAGERGVGGDFDAGFVGLGGISGEDFGGEFGVREFEGGEGGEIFADDFNFGDRAALEGGRFEAGEDGLPAAAAFCRRRLWFARLWRRRWPRVFWRFGRRGDCGLRW